MPVKGCTSDGKPGFKWGEAGTCYTYTTGDASSRTSARDRAIRQGAAIEISKQKSNAVEWDFRKYSRMEPKLDLAASDDAVNKSTPFKNETLGTIRVQGMLEYIGDPVDAILDFYRALKPGGNLILTLPTDDDNVAYKAYWNRGAIEAWMRGGTISDDVWFDVLHYEEVDDFMNVVLSKPDLNKASANRDANEFDIEPIAPVNLEELKAFGAISNFEHDGERATIQSDGERVSVRYEDGNETYYKLVEQDDGIDVLENLPPCVLDAIITVEQERVIVNVFDVLYWKDRALNTFKFEKRREALFVIEDQLAYVGARIWKEFLTTADVTTTVHQEVPKPSNLLGFSAERTLEAMETQGRPFTPTELRFREDKDAFTTGAVCGACRFYLRDDDSAIGKCQLFDSDVEVPWWWTSDGFIDARQEGIASLTKQDDVEHTGLMIALIPDQETRKALALEGGEAEDQLHLTLAFMGKAADLSDEATNDLAALVRNLAFATTPLKARAAGLGRFAGKEDADEDPLYASIDSESVQRFRGKLAAGLEDKGFEFAKDFSFTPHITLAYVKKDVDNPIRNIVPIEMQFDDVSVVAGTKRATFPFGAVEKDDASAAERETEKTTTIDDSVEFAVTLNEEDQPAYKARFVKFDDEQRFTFTVVYKPDDEDAHGEFATADTLQQALWNHVKEGERDTFIQHGFVEGIGFKKAGEWVEIVSWPLEVKTTLALPTGESFRRTIPANSIWMGIIWEPWAWELIKEGKVTGLSFGGRAKRVRPDDDE